MDILGTIIDLITPLIMAGLMWLLARVVPPVRNWFRMNQDHALVALLEHVIVTAVRYVEQTGEGGAATTGAVKKSMVTQRVLPLMEQNAAVLKKTTGQTPAQFVSQVTEAEVLRMNELKSADPTFAAPRH